MRGTGNHTPPATMQPQPPDNTSREIMPQVERWRNTRPGNTVQYPLEVHTTIHTESAREIAAWWQSSGTDGIEFAEFASTGTIGDDLAEAITRELRDLTTSDHDHDQTDALRALLAYVRACKVTVYVVGKNIAGYIPEADVYATLSRRNARDAYDDMLRDEAPKDVARTDECTCGAIESEICELCSTDSLVRGMIADGYTQIGTKGASTVIPAESWAGSMSYWVHVKTMPYGKFVDEYHEEYLY